MPEIGLSLRSELVRDVLSAILLEAGFLVLHKAAPDNFDAIIVIDFDDCRVSETVRAYHSRGIKIVGLASGADSLEISAEEIAPLSGVLTYDLSAAAFVQSLRLISSGERVFPCDLTIRHRQEASTRSTELRSNAVHLSPREREVLLDLVEGHPNKVIARRLGITEATAKVHLKSVLRKINVSNRTQAAIWALANLPELDPASRGFV